MSNEDTLSLWVFFASDGKMIEITHTYARTEIDARVRRQAWMAEQVARGYDHIEVKHYPGGYRSGASTWWVGSVLATQVEQSEARHAAAE